MPAFFSKKLFVDLNYHDWDKMIAVHLRGCFLGCHFAVPIMQKEAAA